ncbi:SAM-dependent methyltransferase [Subtercola boreus]|uniref:SAM-dependent methyltransferase n=1 Tax=Subtercola boreus TaxID=120213 RepID=A0A3E0VKJ1_9MICO|nr:methyltransferase domain-containing protein [Subtercola boreus]RFA09963.1 SAM-dependent methyltransferase [Subtercola boreus]TQL52893.1 methyltransferase family protein [Subtercola boreus]
MSHEHASDPSGHPSTETFWNEHYGQREQIWSGRPNAVLVDEVSALAPGRALDVGCGEGADAIWLAGRGWQVTGVDVSGVALDRARAAAEAAGVSGSVTWQQQDLGSGFPTGEFELVSAQFLHSPVELPRPEILRAAAAAVAPGGRLLIVGHSGLPSWVGHDQPDVHFVTPEEVLASLALDPASWRTISCEARTRAVVDPHGEHATLDDGVVLVERLGAAENPRAGAGQGEQQSGAAA